ncbi:MAG: hypothetical protein AUK55_00050 [Syntrophobacteraceae bacterium CG2_30_61_12]|nr:MAG: hypothetical protein AUK55_00050 [Syntrophobacteraceae bacterium CG2_30_61_12]PIU30755.1 MAG: hypothetical protein COT06_11880 [Syntrophobacteraceae bacterium CG07_land_8_20_14_0_80_61_8]
MKIIQVAGVPEERTTLHGGRIQFGLTKNGGHSSWDLVFMEDADEERMAWEVDRLAVTVAPQERF